METGIVATGRNQHQHPHQVTLATELPAISFLVLNLLVYSQDVIHLNYLVQVS